MELIKYNDKETIAILKATVAQGTTDAEFAMFANFCQATGLNPFKKEIWCIKTGGRLQLMTGINGFRAIANANPAYDGMEIGLIGKTGEYLPATYPKDDYLGAWAKCYRKDRKFSAEGVAMLSDYNKNFGNWKSMKRVMIMKCAESVALRVAFPQQLNGLYTPDEMPKEFEGPAETEVSKAIAAVEPIAEDPVALPELSVDALAGYKLKTKCRFQGVEIEIIKEQDPNWILEVLEDPKKLEKLHPEDRQALETFKDKVL